jgi:hypothetical protein
MPKQMTPKSNFMSVFGQSGNYSGCLIATARGWRTYDALDRHVGYFSNTDAARAALLEMASGISNTNRAGINTRSD